MNNENQKCCKPQNNAIEDIGKAMDSIKLTVGGMVQSAGNMIAPHFPAVDIIDNFDGYIINIDLPGISKENVSLECSDHALVIKATRIDEEETKSAGYIKRERGVSTAYRRIELPEDADRDNLEAELVNGVLRIDIPKKEMSVRKIDLK
ncbi:Hsp20/alpha crystallin family protein [Candidatus Methanomassiliicoccus intestinalis]|jgi:heat shock protein hsp20|uniref:Molecular chaperone (Small heat shock protein) n=2 Tax=Candidatus Methanomassiliicoccus intestinalis TaxID=1406512 RepID=R9T786_METII|nr:Hsp20/alpha crystallin family protein [Candidatus Methanomassiliicoccus intestinalis]AGN26812.1 molecular chaperone (small heat shock protein) [Candidatus Methanomassiliicoccus intestinalis Issoire-Mx1]TQS82931.1 MAG: hypothetical protein A3207_03050 [Candidatus Methanomassiliicoccus intestinalis]TQS83786.1 MAG: hypothetical protein A3206_02885 [Candidatus Methanomassiliicoccus intestinalis]